jgi:HEPN/Toprim N-terminal domain 1
MGSYAECWLGPFYIGGTKNDVHPDLIGLFRVTDKNVIRDKKHSLPFQMRNWLDHVEEDDEVSVLFYRASASIVRDRLELKGYTLDVAKLAFQKSLQAHAQRDSEFEDRAGPSPLKATLDVASRFDPDQCLAAIREVRLKANQHPKTETWAEENQRKSMFDIFEFEWFGYSGPDINVPLRLALEVCDDSDDFIYDLTDIVTSGYFTDDHDFVSNTLSPASDHSNSRRILLTEGRSDSWIVCESLRLLYPHLLDYFTFMDFEGVRIGGGAGSLANIVKAFAGAGILNRVIAMFDNDTAAEAAIRSLRNIRVPENIQVLKLPELESLEKYPTVGPSGPVAMNVNGVAGSIELYLGADVLSNERGELAPVQWTGFETSAGQYQGEVMFKDRIHERFKLRLEACRADASLIQRTDWAGIRLILSAIFVAFHPLDKKLIQELAVLDFFQ